ncbi:hypothetical protein E2C01_007072 [Portunus trituberculatus]|uniref:Uncharacterized protein n=1 Tax=Portunus trituberculatus TaxID=210409 RepID=A0A5B7CYG2_PORTR|nr:hypothetical protein [Portunus trituberculatus]
MGSELTPPVFLTLPRNYEGPDPSKYMGYASHRQVRRFLGASRSVVVFEAARNGSRLDQVITSARQVGLWLGSALL